MEINGTDTGETLTGTADGDVINGKGGNDTINGGNGNDTLNGDAGNDTLNGQANDDTLNGGDGDDSLVDGMGANWFYGGAGNDTITAYAINGNAYADGGSGDDAIALGFDAGGNAPYAGTLIGGEGNDLIAVGHGVGNMIDLGTGDDRLLYVGGRSTITLGDGADEISIGFYTSSFVYPPADGAMILTDYQPGVDRINGAWGAGWLYNWDGSTNPFATGHFILVQDGADAVWRMDRNGGGDNYVDYVRFKNVAATSLTANDLGGFNPSGGALTGVTITGTEGNDSGPTDRMLRFPGSLIGTAGPDVVNGLGGDDVIFTYSGDDVIDGGAGNDLILPGSGADMVHGGEGSDAISGTGGNAFYYGDGGNDSLFVILAFTGHLVMDGGDGDDSFSVAPGNATSALLSTPPGASFEVRGGAGNDLAAFNEDLPKGALVDLGSGDDIMQLYGWQEIRLVLGTGADTVRLETYRNAPALAAIVADYAPGTDRITLPGTSYFTGFTSGSNPFATGHARILQSGTDTLLQFDRDGGGNGYTTVLRLTGIAATGLTAADFGGLTPNAIARPLLTGTPNADTLIGSDGDDDIQGLAGDDMIDGGGGVDNLFGGAGNDSYKVDRQSDLIFENAGEGTDSVVSTANFYLYANVETLTLAAGAGNIFGVGNELANSITGNEGANTLLAGAGVDTVHGGAGIDILYGEDGADLLFGDADNDFLAGGAGDDVMDGGTGGDSLYGEAGDDMLTGGSDFVFDQLVGGDGNDMLHGDSLHGDYDYLYGNAGDDSFFVDTGDDLTFEQAGEGTDTVYANVAGANNGVYLYANVENLVLLGTTTFGVGNGLANTMTGNAAANYLLGGAGNDILNGKAGGDVLFGEGGADRFVFEHGTGGDVIGDFAKGSDRIDLTAIGYGWQQVQNSIHEYNGSTAIDLGGGDLVVLNGVTGLGIGDFILATSPAAAAAPDEPEFATAHLPSFHGLWHGGPMLMPIV